MSEKTPELDSFVIVKGNTVELGVEFSAKGPVGAQVFVNGERNFSTSLHPSKTEFTVDVPFEEIGQHEVQITVEGAAPGELQKLKDGGLEPPEEVTVADATWSIAVAEVDELYQTDTERFKDVVTDLITLISAGSITWKAVNQLRERFDELPEDTQEELTTLSDFTEDEEK